MKFLTLSDGGRFLYTLRRWFLFHPGWWRPLFAYFWNCLDLIECTYMPCYVDAYGYHLELSLNAFVLYHFIFFVFSHEYGYKYKLQILACDMTVLCSGEIFIIGGRSKQKWLVTFENLDDDSSVNESASQFLCRSLGNAFQQWMSLGGSSYWPGFPPLCSSFCTMVAAGVRPKSGQQEIMWVICQPCCLDYCFFVEERHWKECPGLSSCLKFGLFPLWDPFFWCLLVTPGWIDLWPGNAGSGELKLDYHSQAGFMLLCTKWISAIKFHCCGLSLTCYTFTSVDEPENCAPHSVMAYQLDKEIVVVNLIHHAHNPNFPQH